MVSRLKNIFSSDEKLMKSILYWMILLKTKNQSFLSFEYRCVYDIQFTNSERNEEVIPKKIFGCIKFKSHFHGLKKKIRKAGKKVLDLVKK